MIRGIDYIGVGVGALIEREDGNLFLAKRGPMAKNERGLWEFPGGAVEYGEKLEDALKREIYEEFNIEIEVLELLDVVDHIIPHENQHWVSPTYICHLLSGNPLIREIGKCSSIGWFKPQDFPQSEDLTIISRENFFHYINRRSSTLLP